MTNVNPTALGGLVARRPSRSDIFPVLTVGQYKLTFAAGTAGKLPDWTGSAWRGAFGHALKQSVCVTGMKDCAPCPMFGRCVHARIFETPPPTGQGKMRKYTTAPRPYALLPTPGGRIEAGQTMTLALRLFGSANQDHSLIIRALERAAWRGLGRHQLSLKLDQPATSTISTLDAAPGRDLPEIDGDLRVELLTPLRIRIRDRYLGPDDLSFGDFFSILLRRLSMLCSFHERRPFEPDFRALVDAARKVHWQSTDLSLMQLKRYSSRQGTALDMSGLVGELRLGRADAEPFLPWLWLGQHTLVGRGCVMGLGHYRMATVTSAS